MCLHVVKGQFFKHILIYVRDADFCLLISHLVDHSMRFNQKKILSFTFPLLSLSFCWQRYKKKWKRERERKRTTKRQSQRHKNVRVTNQIPAWDLSLSALFYSYSYSYPRALGSVNPALHNLTAWGVSQQGITHNPLLSLSPPYALS